MLNPDFPTTGAGVDLLFASNLVTFIHSGVFVIPPSDGEFPAAGYFKTPAPVHARKGQIHIRKSAIDSAGNPINAEVGGLEFQLIDPGSGNAIGEVVHTNPAGRATLPPVKIGTTVIVRETSSPRFQAPSDITVEVTQAHQLLSVTNQLAPAATPYGA